MSSNISWCRLFRGQPIDSVQNLEYSHLGVFDPVILLGIYLKKTFAYVHKEKGSRTSIIGLFIIGDGAFILCNIMEQQECAASHCGSREGALSAWFQGCPAFQVTWRLN